MTDATRPHERSLRAAPDPGAGPYEEPDELDTLHDRSILVVDDDPAAIKLVRQILSELEVPIVFITAYPERLLTGERPEPTFLVTKPFIPETVRVAVSQALLFA